MEGDGGRRRETKRDRERPRMGIRVFVFVLVLVLLLVCLCLFLCACACACACVIPTLASANVTANDYTSQRMIYKPAFKFVDNDSISVSFVIIGSDPEAMSASKLPYRKISSILLIDCINTEMHEANKGVEAAGRKTANKTNRYKRAIGLMCPDVKGD